MSLSVDDTRQRHYERSPLNVAMIREQLRTRIFGVGERLHYVPVVDSTNTLAMRLAREEAIEEGTVILTDSQTAGKGRLGRRWIDAFGYNVLSSTVLWPHFPLYFLVMCASLAVVDTIDDLFGKSMSGSPTPSQAAIKWPNDVLISERKVAGILVETSHDRSGRLIAILGIGVNVYQLPLHSTEDAVSLLERATTLETAFGANGFKDYAVSREAFIARLLQHLEVSYFALQQEQETQDLVDLDTVEVKHSVYLFNSNLHTSSRILRERWRGRLTTLGRAVQVRQGNTLIEGVAEDVDERGELLLRRSSGERVTITWGDVGYPTGTPLE